MDLDDLKNRIKEYPISEIIGRYLSIRRKSNNYIAICPFHNDTSPSLHINDKLGIYKCFACQHSGDSIKFVREYKHLDYVDALKELAAQLSINFDDYIQKKKNVSEKEQIMRKLLITTNQLFLKLAENNPIPFNNFLQTRQLTPEIAKKFSLGLTTKANTLTNYLHSLKDPTKRNKAIEAALELDLIKPSHYENQSHYDTFRERITFPIWDQFGNIVGFGGRDYGGKVKSKYLNSSDSIIFKKSNILYGLNLAKYPIREQQKVLIVEGYMDVVALHRYGFDYSVAVMGVALGSKRAMTLKNMTTNIYLALDSDNAGQQAMKRINQELMELGILPRYINYAPSKDADEFLQNYGALELQKRIDEAPLFLDEQVKKLIADSNTTSINERLATLHQIFALLTPLGDSLQSSELAIAYAKELGINSSAEQITTDFKQFLSTQKKKSPLSSPAPSNNSSITSIKSSEQLKETEPTSTTSPTPRELMLIEEVIAHPEIIKSDNFTKILDFSIHNDVKEFIWELKDFLLEIDDHHYTELVVNFSSGDKFSLDIQQAVANGVLKYTPSELNEKVINRMLKDLEFRLKEEQILQEKESLFVAQQKVATSEEKTELMQKIHRLDYQLQQLKKEHQQR